MNLEQVLIQRKITPAVRERILRLNPNPREGQLLRGYHPNNHFRYWRYTLDCVPKGEFIRKHRRKAWDALPNGLKYKDGRRRWVSRKTLLDNEWKIWAGLCQLPEMVVWFPTRMYAGDPRLTMEFIPRQEFRRRMGWA